MKGMINLTRKNYSLIPVLAAIVTIPQLLFWWLAPMSVAACPAVYIGGTVLTVAIPVAYFMTYRKSNVRKTAGLFFISCILEIAVIALSALLLWVDASVRTTVFVFVITTLLYLIILIPMISSALKVQRQGVYSAAIPVEPSDQSTPDFRNHNSHTSGVQQRNSVPARTLRQSSVSKPLPPRNR